MQTLTREIHNGTTYLTTEYRGSAYTLRRTKYGWELSTKRLALAGFSSVGGCKFFNTLADVKAKCKAFAGIELTEAL